MTYTKDTLWEEVYNFNGFALADYLNMFDSKVYKASQHGEKVFVEDVSYDEENNEIYDDYNDIFSEFYMWRFEVCHYFNGFCERFIEKFGELNENAKTIFVYKIICILGLLAYETDKVENSEEFIFC